MKFLAPKFSADELRSVLSYDDSTGVFTWAKRTSNRIKVGDVAGVAFNGYVLISVFGQKLMAHRLAVYYMTDEWPESDVDHINECRNDNRYSNLRVVSHSANLMNRKAAFSSNKHSGMRGVHLQTQTGKWRARLKHMGKEIHIGVFDTIELARAAYLSRVESLHA